MKSTAGTVSNNMYSVGNLWEEIGYVALYKLGNSDNAMRSLKEQRSVFLVIPPYGRRYLIGVVEVGEVMYGKERGGSSRWAITIW